VMVAQVPILSVLTLYPYIGDLFAWLALAGFVGLVVVGVIRSRRAGREKPEVPESIRSADW
jgi:apolipoprotein N-acyltransferase